MVRGIKAGFTKNSEGRQVVIHEPKVYSCFLSTLPSRPQQTIDTSTSTISLGCDGFYGITGEGNAQTTTMEFPVRPTSWNYHAQQCDGFDGITSWNYQLQTYTDHTWGRRSQRERCRRRRDGSRRCCGRFITVDYTFNGTKVHRRTQGKSRMR